jgi:hypothetical protein
LRKVDAPLLGNKIVPSENSFNPLVPSGVSKSLEELTLPMWIAPTSEVLTKGRVPPLNNASFCGAELPAPTSASSPKGRTIVITNP